MANAMLKEAEVLLRNGNQSEAQKILIQLVREEPNNANAWYGLSLCVADECKKRDCLLRALQFNPDHRLARNAMDRLDGKKNGEGNLSIVSTVKPQPSDFVSAVTKNDEEEKVLTKKAGTSTRKMAETRRKNAFRIGIIVLAVFFVIFLFTLDKENVKSIGVGGTAVLLMLVLVGPKITENILDKKLKESDRAIRGAKAEEKIGDLLDGLKENYLVVHDINCAYGNIDHLVISQKGNLFMVETKSHHGKITVDDGRVLLNGHDPEKDFIAQSLRNSYWLRDLIGNETGTKPWVTPLLVFTNAYVIASKPVKGVYVLNKKYLEQMIRSMDMKNRGNPIVWEKRREWLKRFDE
jgi:hypothetical protein